MSWLIGFPVRVVYSRSEKNANITATPVFHKSIKYIHCTTDSCLAMSHDMCHDWLCVDILRKIKPVRGKLHVGYHRTLS